MLRLAIRILTGTPIRASPRVAVFARRLGLVWWRGGRRAAGPANVRRHHQDGGNGEDNEPNWILRAHGNRSFPPASKSARPRALQGPRQLGSPHDCNQPRRSPPRSFPAWPADHRRNCRARCSFRCGKGVRSLPRLRSCLKQHGCVRVSGIARANRRCPSMQRALGLADEPPDSETSLTRSCFSGPAHLRSTDGVNSCQIAIRTMTPA
jgi:hypothetical protein